MVQNAQNFCIILLSITNKMQLYTIFFIMPMLYMFQAASPPIIRSSKTVHTASGIRQACLLLSQQASLAYTRCFVYSF